MSPSNGGLPRGYESCWFSVQELAAAVAVGADGPWEAGRLRTASGAAASAAGAVLAADVAARGAELCLADDGGARLRLRLRLLTDLPPGAAPPLWFDDAALAALRMPFLTLANIKGGRSYECHVCAARFERPNPLKLHLFLGCGRFEPRAFWTRALPRLAPALPLPVAVGVETANRLDATLTPIEPALARLEALAAEWGKSRGGHACVYCGKLYSRKYGLKIHIRTHTGYKPLRCRYCARAFGDPSNLNKHVRLHAGSAASGAGLACAQCGARVARRRDLERHVRARHRSPVPVLTRKRAPIGTLPSGPANLNKHVWLCAGAGAGTGNAGLACADCGGRGAKLERPGETHQAPH
ncbi:unnamed protein product [Chilo suppressalis]|uniref:C2H2-type domain-containing protein n=1 Tax=Chilo suppressalis TaxID=168631 RepID=A0ABN8BC30_CHISP|nr:unnamed protein product [Chilo suppressalis]